MKSIFLTILYVAFTFSVYSQQKPFAVKISNKPLITVLKEVEKKFDLFFSYKVKDVKNLTVNLVNEATSINSLLQQILASTNLQYEIVDSNFIIIKQKQTPQTNLICGTVYDYQNKNPLPYANVIIEHTTTGTTTDENGNFQLKHTSNQNENLIISYVGYEAQTFELSTFNNKNCPAVLLRMPKIKEAFLIIKDYLTDGVSVESNGAATNIKPQLIGNMPGLIEPDIMSTIQFLPGIAAPTSRVSDIYIRGCTPDQNLIIWEDIPVYYTAHYFGMISSINPHIIKNTNVYRGGFNATYGGRIGGVIELLSPDETAYKNNFGLGANMTHSQAYAHQKFKLAKSPSSITFSLRRSYNEIFETPTFKTYTSISQQGLLFKGDELNSLPENQVNIENDFYFLDANFKFSTQINAKNKFQLAGIYAGNSFNDDIIDNGATMYRQKDSLYLISRGLSIKWQHQWNNNATTIVKAVTANDSLNYKYNVVKEGKNEKPVFEALRENSVTDRQLVVHNTFDGSNGQNWQVGYHYTNYKVNYRIYEDERRGNFKESDPGQADLHALYAHYQNPIENKIGIQAGFRISKSSIAASRGENKIEIEPRLRIDYKLSELLSLHSSFGLYHQVLSQLEVFKGKKLGFEIPIWELANKEFNVQKSEMYQAGLIFQANNWVVDLQAYNRKINGISSRAYSIETIPENRPENGSSNIVGIDVLVKKRIGKFRSWLSYSLSKANLSFKINGKRTTFASNYDQRNIVDWSNQLRLNNWQFSAGFKFSSGLPYTEVIGINYFSNNQPPKPINPVFPYQPIYGSINAKNLPYNTSLNISANYQFKPLNQKWKAYFAASIINVLNANNVYEKSFVVIENNNEAQIEPINKTSLPITPNVSIRFEW